MVYNFVAVWICIKQIVHQQNSLYSLKQKKTMDIVYKSQNRHDNDTYFSTNKKKRFCIQIYVFANFCTVTDATPAAPS